MGKIKVWGNEPSVLKKEKKKTTFCQEYLSMH